MRPRYPLSDSRFLQMVLTQRDHRTRLQHLHAFRMLGNDPHCCADRETIKAAVNDTVAVEINILTGCGQNEPAVTLCDEPDDPAVIGNRVLFDRTAAVAGMFFEQSAGCVEAIANRNMCVLMGMIGAWIASEDDLAARNANFDPNGKQLPLLMPSVPRLDDNPTHAAVALK